MKKNYEYKNISNQLSGLNFPDDKNCKQLSGRYKKMLTTGLNSKSR